MKNVKVLFITTSHDKLGDTGRNTGVWLEELATPYYEFKEAGAGITIASPGGGQVPLDPKSESIILATPNSKRFLKDPEAMNWLSGSVRLEEIKAINFDLVFLPGGHGPMWDLASNEIIKQLLEDFCNQNKPIAAVCHGVVSLLSLQNSDGTLLIKGKHLTGFSNSEEESAGLTRIMPFLLETRLVSAGAIYSKGPDHTGYVVADDNFITGQNPASSEEVAKKTIARINHNKQISMYYTLPSVT
jgi:putative intracellular protease/amidase